MKYFSWSIEKNEKLKRERYVSFEEVVYHIEPGDVLDILEHPKPVWNARGGLASPKTYKEVHMILRGIILTMGLIHVEGVVTGTNDKHVRVRFLVDSGATYTLLPHSDWQAIALSPKRLLVFTLADGTAIERQVSECHIALSDGEAHTPVILGEPDDEALLGTVTLEILGLMLNPFKRTLEPMRMLLA
ncbi:retroviral-like aspartic protease family protein [Acidobacteria bacterium AH-259-A15]|nr:retroviral-like aspartic protease family protein [Acidobacteria bacterium AH-259-A15]